MEFILPSELKGPKSSFFVVIIGLHFIDYMLFDVTSSQSEYTFRRQLKTWLLKKSFPDIII